MVSIQLEDVESEKITVDDSKLTFSGKSHNKLYELTLEFNNSIIPEESKQEKKGREYFFVLKKKEQGPFWPRLLKEKTKNQKVKIDFGRWKDEDESEDEQGGGAGYDDANLEDMMRQMGTGGEDDGFDPGEGPDSEDSDDEEIPELEKE